MTNEEAAHELDMLRPYQSHPRVDKAMEHAVKVLRSPATGAEAMREAAAKVAETFCPGLHVVSENEWRAPDQSDVNEQLAAAIRSLPLPAPEAQDRDCAVVWETLEAVNARIRERAALDRALSVAAGVIFASPHCTFKAPDEVRQWLLREAEQVPR